MPQKTKPTPCKTCNNRDFDEVDKVYFCGKSGSEVAEDEDAYCANYTKIPFKQAKIMKSSITTFGQKLDGEQFKYEKPDELDAFWEQAQKGRYVIEIKRKRPPKSQKQCGVIFGLMIKQAVEQAEEKTIGVEDLMLYLLARGIPKGQAITKDYLHALMYIIAPTFNDEGKEVTLSKMDTKQAASLFDRFRNIMAGINIVIDDPNPNWRTQKKEK